MMRSVTLCEVICFGEHNNVYLLMYFHLVLEVSIDKKSLQGKFGYLHIIGEDPVAFI